MGTAETTPLVEAFLLVEAPRQRFTHWTQALAALDSPMAPPLASVVAHYDPTTDQALLNLRYDALALGPNRLEFVVEVALLAEVGMIQPAALSEGERRRFLSERLARCTLVIQYQRSTIGALTELVRRLRDQRGDLRTGAKPPPFRTTPRGDTSDPVPLVALSAKGTRNDIAKIIPTKPTREDVTRPERGLVQHFESFESKFERPPSPHRHVIARSSRAKTVVAPESNATNTTNNAIPEAEEIPFDSSQIIIDTDDFDDLPPPPPPLRSTLERAQSPQFSTSVETPNTIYARYLRSGKWVPIRVGSLSLKGAALMTGALPRLHDHVDVALSYSGHRALVRGAVGKVSSVREAAATGASTFSVSFELDTASRRQLTTLLTAAREAKVTIKPPPPRATRRFVVEWPVCLGTMRGAMKADALDVSSCGMFVRPVLALTVDTTCNFSVVLDDGGGPIAGRAKIVRQLGEQEAAACGLAPGFGLSILDMGDIDRKRWEAFITRIERRADKRVLIGASPARLTELQTALAAAGYAVMGGTDPGALVQLASSDTRPVDAALIDAGWLQNGVSASWVESLFSARDVPCVTVHGDPRRARSSVDKLLEVVV